MGPDLLMNHQMFKQVFVPGVLAKEHFAIIHRDAIAWEGGELVQIYTLMYILRLVCLLSHLMFVQPISIHAHSYENTG